MTKVQLLERRVYGIGQAAQLLGLRPDDVRSACAYEETTRRLAA